MACRLQQIPGIDPVTATALVASVGDARQFRRARDMAAWLGLGLGLANKNARIAWALMSR